MVEDIRSLANTLDDSEAVRLAAAAEATLDRTTFHLAVLGEFKRGKSSLVNALLDIDALPTDILPSTAVLTVVEYSEEEACRVTWNDGRTETWPVTREAMERLTVEGDLVAEEIRHAVITLNLPLLKDRLVLIDTPGVNDLSDARAEVTYGIIPHSDAALFLLDATAPLTRSEADFLTTKVLTHKLDSLLFVLSKADRLDEDEREEALDGARQRIKEVLGVDGLILPYSSLETQRARDRGEEAPMHRSLMDRIGGLREDADGGREQRAGATLQLAAQQLMMKIDTMEALLSAEQGQVVRLREDLQAAESRQQVAFARLRESINRVGRGALSDMMNASIERFFGDFHRDLDNQIKLQGQQIDRFWRGLPVTIERQLRQYIERKSQEIQVFLDRFVAHTAEEYRKHFDEPLRQDMERHGIALPKWHEEVSEDDSSTERQQQRKQRVLMLGSAAVLGIATALVFPSAAPFAAMAGMYGGQELSSKISSHETHKKCELYQQDLAERMTEMRRELQRQINTRIDVWFDEFLASVEEHRQKRLKDLRDDLDARLNKEQDGSLPKTVDLVGMRQQIETLLKETTTKEDSAHV